MLRASEKGVSRYRKHKVKHGIGGFNIEHAEGYRLWRG